MRPAVKSILFALATGAAVCAGYAGISAQSVMPDFLKNRKSAQEAARTAHSFRTPHRKTPGKRLSPQFPGRATTDTYQAFQCVVTYSDNWDDSQEAGVYTFDASTPISFRQTFVSDEYLPTGGAFFTDKYYILTAISEDWFTGDIDVYSYKYSRNDWEELSYTASDVYSLYNCICFDPIDNVAYGFFSAMKSETGATWILTT